MEFMGEFMGRKRVVVAMSGGVDSSTSAALLKEQGFEVIGLSMQLWDYSKGEEKGEGAAGSCCSLEDIYDARRVCDTLAIPFYVVNMEGVFSREVIDYFVKGYLGGSTPNPCIKCNEVMKFTVLLKRAMELEADFLATGHYARIRIDKDGGYRLLKGVDGGKDQSYFLFTMRQGQIKKVLFPLGELDKGRVRELAKKFGLRVSAKKESQEICFVQNGRYADFVSVEAGSSTSGEIVDGEGNIIGTHRGLFRYTIGQRKGLDIKRGDGPFYVTGMDVKRNRLIAGRDKELYSSGLFARDINWINSPPSKGERIIAKIRYRHIGADSFILPEKDGISVIFSTPQKSVTPGQAVVFYRGEEVLGGGWIERALAGC